MCNNCSLRCKRYVTSNLICIQVLKEHLDGMQRIKITGCNERVSLQNIAR